MKKQDWITLLHEANVGPKPDKIPSGYKSMKEWLEEFEIGETQWRRKIPILEEKGQMIVGHYKALGIDGRLVKRKFWKRK